MTVYMLTIGLTKIHGMATALAFIPSIEMQRYHSFFTKTKGGVGFICVCCMYITWFYVLFVLVGGTAITVSSWWNGARTMS